MQKNTGVSASISILHIAWVIPQVSFFHGVKDQRDGNLLFPEMFLENPEEKATTTTILLVS